MGDGDAGRIVSKQLNDPIARLVGLARHAERRHIIGLSGVPGSGKTTLAARWLEGVRRAAGEGAMIVLGMDGFHLSRAELRALPNPDEAFARRGAPWTFDPAAMADRLRALHDGFRRSTVDWPDFEHGVGDPVEGAHRIPPEVAIVMVEGIYTALTGGDWGEVHAQFDEQWYLDVPWSEAAPRLVARHMSAWNMTEDKATRRAESNDRVNAELVERGRALANWLVYPQTEVVVAKIDLKKQFKDLYNVGARAKAPHLVEVPPLQYVMVDGSGDPNTSEEYQRAMGALYAVAYTVKFVAKDSGSDFGVMPLEGLWWTDPPEAFALADKSDWSWTAMILQPDFVSTTMIDDALA